MIDLNQTPALLICDFVWTDTIICQSCKKNCLFCEVGLTDLDLEVAWRCSLHVIQTTVGLRVCLHRGDIMHLIMFVLCYIIFHVYLVLDRQINEDC